MSRVVYVNGRFVPYAGASVHVEDRGYQFAEAVYEVIQVKSGRLIDEVRHMQRLTRSMFEVGIPEPMSSGAWRHVLRETIRRNRLKDGSVYVQVSRGSHPRDFSRPPAAVTPTVVCIARLAAPATAEARAEKGVTIKTLPDIRWRRCDLKTVMLLPAVLAKEAARASGASDAWFVDAGGYVTEGASNNAWIVDPDGRLITRQCDTNILPGVTRLTLLDLLQREDIVFIERPFTIAEARRAREAFLTSATNTVMPVVAIDGQPIGNGAPGSVATRLRAAFQTVAEVSDP